MIGKQQPEKNRAGYWNLFVGLGLLLGYGRVGENIGRDKDKG